LKRKGDFCVQFTAQPGLNAVQFDRFWQGKFDLKSRNFFVVLIASGAAILIS